MAPHPLEITNHMRDRLNARYFEPLPRIMGFRYSRLRAKSGAPSSWTAAEAAEAAELEAALDWYVATLAALHTLHQSLPEDYDNNSHWPAPPPPGTYY